MELLAVLLAAPFMSVEADDPPCKASCRSLPWAPVGAGSAEGSSGPKPESSREPGSPADSRDLPSSWFPSVLLRLTLLTKFENEPPAHAWLAVDVWGLQAADTSNQGAWCTFSMLGAADSWARGPPCAFAQSMPAPREGPTPSADSPSEPDARGSDGSFSLRRVWSLQKGLMSGSCPRTPFKLLLSTPHHYFVGLLTCHL